MSLQPIPATNDELAKNIARQILQQIKSVRDNVDRLRTQGVAARPPTEERTMPDGRVIPASPGIPAISGNAIENALGELNCELLDQVKEILG
jgi:hypothetical protein